MKQKINKYFLFLFLFCSCIDLKAQKIQIIDNEKYSLDSLKKILNNKKLMMICFEGLFKGENIKIESNKQIIFSNSLFTNQKLGVARRIFFNKNILPVKIYIANEVYKLNNNKNRFVYISYRDSKLHFNYSNTYRLYK